MKPLTAIRIGLGATLALAGSWFAANNAVANATRTRAPAVAISAAPNDGRVLANYSQMLVQRAQSQQAQGQKVPFPAVAGDARKALRHEPLNSIALRLLALDAENKGDIAAAGKLIALSERVTRRDGGTQLWLIMASSQTNDVAQVIRHCDILLRTQPDAMSSLAPILNRAIEDRAFRTAMRPYLRRPSPWLPDYLNFAAGNATSPRAVSAMFRMAGGVPESKVRQETESILLARLIDADAADEALRFFPLMKGARPEIAARADFSVATTDPRFAPVAWEALSPDTMVATFDQEGDGRLSLNVVASSGVRGVVARKLLTLGPGSYRFSQNIALATAGDRHAAALWRLSCLSSTGRQNLWQTSGTWRGAGRYSLDGPTIAASCPIQMLELEVAGGLAGDGVELSIASLGFSKGGGNIAASTQVSAKKTQ